MLTFFFFPDIVNMLPIIHDIHRYVHFMKEEKQMKILIFGAGVIGCEIAHELCCGNNDITLLARGSWRETIARKGLVIRHSGQFHTTVDHVQTIENLEQDDFYDLIIVVMQYNQMQKVLSELAENISHNILFVGNNMTPSACQNEIIQNTSVYKNIAFGFQGSGGKRKKDKVISMHFRPSMTLGGLCNNLSSDYRKFLQDAFSGTKYQLVWETYMEGWLLSHAAHILPTAYLCYILQYNLTHVSREQVRLSVKAVAEAHQMLKQLGYPIRPDREADTYSVYEKKKNRSLYFFLKSPAGKFVISIHCANAISEMLALSSAFDELRNKSDSAMPSWDSLRKEALISLGEDGCNKSFSRAH